MREDDTRITPAWIQFQFPSGEWKAFINHKASKMVYLNNGTKLPK
jgi:hypothetical protein